MAAPTQRPPRSPLKPATLLHEPAHSSAGGEGASAGKGSLARVLSGEEELGLPPDLIMAVRQQLLSCKKMAADVAQGKVAVHIGAGAPVFLAGVLQGLMKTLLKDAGHSAAEPECKQGSDSEGGGGKKVIIPKDIQQALKRHLTVVETQGIGGSKGSGKQETKGSCSMAYLGDVMLSAEYIPKEDVGSAAASAEDAEDKGQKLEEETSEVKEPDTAGPEPEPAAAAPPLVAVKFDPGPPDLDH